jgi:hypothetical protein
MLLCVVAQPPITSLHFMRRNVTWQGGTGTSPTVYTRVIAKLAEGGTMLT